ncbi:MAG: 16S rRNA (guanine(966)-N(2))-methyltransferase RsmD [Bacteroidales bacterium]|nr:16S rRNA (guanine(966)-N(2))-methyltransferase RsmD [Bacteroidales bacterium]
MRIIGGSHKRRQLHPPNNLPVRPTTDMAKEALFNILEHWIDWEHTAALDLFSGTGSIALEMISRGSSQVTAVDQNRNCVQWIKKASQDLEMNTLQVVQSDVFKLLSRPSFRKYDLIFADPPYDLDKFHEIPQLIFNNNFLNPDGWFVIEHPISVNFETSPYFSQHRKYGKVNFSFFHLSDSDQ